MKFDFTSEALPVLNTGWTVLLKRTSVAPSSPLPVIVTGVPGPPAAGEKPRIVGDAATTVIVIVAALLLKKPSFATNVNVSVPANPVAGV